MKQLLQIIFFVFVLASCADTSPNWSDAEKENIQYFFTSIEASLAATALSNEIGRENQPRTMMSEVVSLREIALIEAKLVDDSVLLKAHPELPENFRNLYQESLEQFILAFETQDNQASMRYSSLSEQWGNWYQNNKSQIRIPR